MRIWGFIWLIGMALTALGFIAVIIACYHLNKPA